MKLHWQDFGSHQVAWGMGAIYDLTMDGVNKYRITKEIMGPIVSFQLDVVESARLDVTKQYCEPTLHDMRVTVSSKYAGQTIFKSSSMDEAKAWAEKDCSQ
jgi:hypothetical protein